MFEPFLASRVAEAHCFKYHHYIRPETIDPALEKQARIILSGNLKNPWVDRNIKSVLYYKRIIKDIRCNLMLGWLKKLLPDMPIVLLVRHPLAIAYSWENLGWGIAEGSDKLDVDLIFSQNELLEDYPVIREAMKEFNKSSLLETTLFVWCVLYHVPFKHLNPGDAFVLTYEDAMLNPESTFAALFNYLNIEFNWNEINPLLNIPSNTNFLRRDFEEKENVLFGWKSRYSDEEVKRTNQILTMFGLQNLYNGDGLPSKDLPEILNSRNSLIQNKPIKRAGRA